MVEDETSIPLSRTKLALLIAGSAAFVAISIWLLKLPDESILPRRSPVIVHGMAVIGIIFFGLCGVVGVRKLFSKSVGLQLSNTGITDTSSGIATGFVPWNDIQGFDIYKVSGSSFLVIKVFDPEKYVAKGNRARQMLARANLGMCGSPLAISSNALAISFSDLTELFDRYYAKYGQRK